MIRGTLFRWLGFGASGVFFTLSFIGSASAAGPGFDISPTALLARCYGQITGLPIPFNHPLLAAVRTGQTSAVAACVSVLDKAQLNDQNTVSAGASDSEAVAVMNTFNNFHRSWFSTTKIEDIIDHGPDTGQGTYDIYDPSEPALAITYHLFKSSSPYRDVLRDSRGFTATRQENIAIKNLGGYQVSMPSRRLYGNAFDYELNIIVLRAGNLVGDLIKSFLSDVQTNERLQMPLIQVGNIVGVAPQSQSFTIPNVVLNPLGIKDGGVFVRDGKAESGLNYSYDFYNSFGGGVLGQPIYLMMNVGHPKGLAYDGAEKLPRRWALNSMQTFLCSQFPVLREADVASFLDQNGTAPFRKGVSCLQCHATMDQAAMTARNIVPAGSEWNAISVPGVKTTDLLTSYQTIASERADWPSSADPDYHLRPAKGVLLFRSSVNGALINRSVNGISGLGEAMSDTDDYYQCAAQRYFEFLTGINVSLYDRTDSRFESVNRSLTSENLKDRAFVEKLGTHLKQTQSLRQLIVDIISSDYYKNSNFRPSRSK